MTDLDRTLLPDGGTVPPDRPVRAPRSRAGRGRTGWHTPAWLVAPALGGLGLTLVLPTLYLLGLAFTSSSLAHPLVEWTGWDNFESARESLAFKSSLVRSLAFAALATTAQVVLGIALAALLRARGPRFGLTGALLLLPLVTPPVIVAVAWKLMLAPVGGPVAGTWADLGLGRFDPLADGVGAFAVLVVVNTWQWLPFTTLLVFAALLGVDEEVLEAAQVDGAGRLSTFLHVTWPSIKPTVVSATLLAVVINFKVFDLVVTITSGGPGISTILAPFEIFRTGLRGDFDMGTAAAETLVFALVVGVVTTVLSRVRDRANREAV